MRISILAKSALGWWSIGLVVASIAFAELSEPILGVPTIQNMALFITLVIVFAGLSGAASATGLISIIKRKQGAILVFISTAIGLVLLIAEVADAVQTVMGLP